MPIDGRVGSGNILSMENKVYSEIIEAAHTIVGAVQDGHLPAARKLNADLRKRIPAIAALHDKDIETLLLDLEFLVDEHDSVSTREIYLELADLASRKGQA